MNTRFVYLMITFLLPLAWTFSTELPYSPSITTYDGYTKTVKGQPEDKQLIDYFPKSYYQITAVNGIGSFYIGMHVDIIKNRLRRGEVWEQEIVDLIKEYALEGSTVVDIGSHIGTHTVTMSKKVGTKGRVVAFEPQKNSLQNLS